MRNAMTGMHHCHTAASAAVKKVASKLFTAHGCESALIIPIFELFLYMVLLGTLCHRHREAIVPSSAAARRLRKTGISTISKIPYEALIMLAVTSTHWLLSVYVPFSKAFVAHPSTVLGGFNVHDTTTLFMWVYVAILEVIEEKHFKKHIIKSYYRQKAKGNVCACDDTTAEKRAVVDVEAEARAEEATPMLATSEKDVQDANEEAATPQPRTLRSRVAAWYRARARKYNCQLPVLTPMLIVSRYQTRAFFKASLTLIFLFLAGTQLCQLEPAKYLDAADNGMVMMMSVSAVYTVRAVQMLWEGYRFMRAEI